MIWSTHHVVGRLSVVGRGGVQGSTEWEKHPTFRGAGWRLDPFVLVHTQTNSKIDQFLFVFHVFGWWLNLMKSYLMYEHNVFISQVFFFLVPYKWQMLTAKTHFCNFLKTNMFFLSFTLKIVLVMIHHPHTHTKKCECVTKSWDR
jgi:hypothetical protein